MWPESAEHPQHRRPLWLAALVTTFVAPVPYAGYEAIHAIVTRGSLASDAYTVSPVFGIMVAGTMVSAFSMYVVGLPVVLALRNSGRLTLNWLCLAGAGAGLAGVIAVALVFKAPPHPALLAFGLGFGAMAGCVFGLVAGVRRKHTAATGDRP